MQLIEFYMRHQLTFLLGITIETTHPTTTGIFPPSTFIKDDF